MTDDEKVEQYARLLRDHPTHAGVIIREADARGDRILCLAAVLRLSKNP